MMFLDDMNDDLLAEWRKKSQLVLYETDPEAWLWDVLGRRWWSKQREMAQSMVENEFTIAKSCNGVGKTQWAGDMVSWWVSVFPARETMALVSAPVRNQIDENMFRYLRENYYVAAERKQPLRGEITRWPKWVIGDPYDKDLVLPKRPADQNLISSFQGIHLDHVMVMLDEAGGLQEEFYIAANAVTTNQHARIGAIGNPDVRNTAFHERFKSENAADIPLPGLPTDEQVENDEVFKDGSQWFLYGDKHRDWHRFTIGYNDTPNATGEMIYPEDLELDAKIKGRLVQKSWAQMMRRSASPGVIAAKVDGEFPQEGDDSFFPQHLINKAWSTYETMKELIELGEEEAPPYRYLGVDVAFSGEDKNVVYLNVGGMITKLDEWDKGGEGGLEAVEDMPIALRVHRLAMENAVDQVRIDAAGSSRGVHSLLKTEPQFMNRTYILIGVIGNNASPDKNKWYNARAWHYDDFRKAMREGRVGINMADVDLKTDLEVQTAHYTTRSQLVIDSKKEIKKALKHSPDHLDAVIYSAIDYTSLIEDPAAGLARGDVVLRDPWDEIQNMAGMPI